MIDKRRLSLVQDVLDALETSASKYRLLSQDEAESNDDWLQRTYPMSAWGRIAWERVPNSICQAWADFDERLQLLNQVIVDNHLGNPNVVIIWSNAVAPSMELELDSIRHVGGIALAADFDTWIVCKSEGWCIEVHHDGEVCFGRVS